MEANPSPPQLAHRLVALRPPDGHPVRRILGFRQRPQHRCHQRRRQQYPEHPSP